MPRQIGLLVFPGVQSLDIVGPLDVFASLPDTQVHLLWKNTKPVTASTGLTMTPTTAYADCPALDVICVPGGTGIDALLEDEETLAFLRRIAPEAAFITSVCTGALVLGAAGLIKGLRATTHWTVVSLLSAFGATHVDERVVVDGKLITGGGVTAGIDFALTTVAQLYDLDTAKSIQLQLEYAPAPPFHCGNPKEAEPAILQAARDKAQPRFAHRATIVGRITGKGV